MDRVDLVNLILKRRGTYLEIGVRGGETFWAVRATTKIGVDPRTIGRKLRALERFTRIATRLGYRRGPLFFPVTSDEFFASRAALILGARRLDCVLVDGLHTADQAYRDVEHALEWLTPGGVIVMHDCSRSEISASPSFDEAIAALGHTAPWNGEVWRAVLRLRTRDDLRVRVLDADEGLGIVEPGAPDDVLPLTLEDIATMSYADFDADRVRLLNLVHEDAFA